MPKTLGGIFAFVITATLTVVVGNFVWGHFVAPLVSRVRKAA